MHDYYVCCADGNFGHASGVIDDTDVVLDWDSPINPERNYRCYWRGYGRPFSDLIDPSGNPLIVSPKALELIEQFRLPQEIEFGDVTLLAADDDSVVGYAEDAIVGNAKLILLRSVARDVMDPVDFKAFRKLPPMSRLRGIPLPPLVRWDLVANYDLILGLGTNWLCSEPLKEAIEEVGLTGAEFFSVRFK